MTIAKVNHTMLSWARNRAGLSVSEMANHYNGKDEKITAWELGTKQPTFKQAMTFAKKTHVPFGYLFLSNPPQETLQIPDLRTLNSQNTHDISPELYEIIEKMRSRQTWYREYLIELDVSKNEIIGRFTFESDVKEVVKDIRKTLKVEVHPTKGNWENYYRDLIKRIENVGILVMRQRFLKFNSRELNVEEFRGFALVDDYAPLIFINHADVPYARIFTLIHELAHLWINQSGVSDTCINNHRKEEKFCNAVAGEFLVDEEVLKDNWNDLVKPWHTQIDNLIKIFHVSRWVIARRALSLGYISNSEYNIYTNDLRKKYLEKQSKNTSGGSFYNSRRSEISKPFQNAVLNEIKSGKLLISDGSNLLGLKPKHLKSFENKNTEISH